MSIGLMLEGMTVPLADIEREVARQLGHIEDLDELTARHARMSNLVIYCDHADQAARVEAELPGIVTLHPARVLLLLAEPSGTSRDVTACVRTGWLRRGLLYLCTEQVTLRAEAPGVERLPYLLRELLIGDVPTNIWWASTLPPPLAGSLLYELAEQAQQIIYDSLGWLEPARGVAAVAAWLERFERGPGDSCWRVASDLNWRRLKFWRRLLTQAFDPTTAPGALDSITEVLLEHGPHAVVQAWELASWLGSRLGWQVQAGRVQPSVELTWQVQAAHGSLRLRLRRLTDGPSEIRRMRIACTLNQRPVVFQISAAADRRLTLEIEGADAAPLTLTLQPQPVAELIGRQLSDRERDPVFRASMAVAQVLARSVLD
jgi:glucose-6-phosphate dehydrogenase assembly protein OpcA